jgi:hypothetical protein
MTVAAGSPGTAFAVGLLSCLLQAAISKQADSRIRGGYFAKHARGYWMVNIRFKLHFRTKCSAVLDYECKILPACFAGIMAVKITGRVVAVAGRYRF